jgi:microcystin-dependent protein
MTSLLRTNAALTARTRPLTGDTKMTFVNDDHMGWLRCNGRALNTTAFNLLFQVIGYTFGGSGDTFYLPNPEGRVIGSVGTVVDENEHTQSYAPGDMVGELDHQLTIGEMPAHNHDINTPPPGANTTANGVTSSNGAHNHSYQDAYFAENTGRGEHVGGTNASTDADNDLYFRKSNGGYTSDPNDPLTQLATSSASNHAHEIRSNGNNEYHNNVPPTLFYGNTFIYCGIPTYGTYPFTTGRNPVLI